MTRRCQFNLLKPAISLLFTLIVASVQSAAADDGVDYLRQVKPIFRQKCYACHGALKQHSGLRLDTVLAIRQGGESGAAIEPGKPHASPLIERVSATDDSRMPPAEEGTPLTIEEIDLVRRWIAAGAPAPDDERPQIDPATHWSHLPPVRPAVPLDQSSLEAPRSDATNPIDAFLAAEHGWRGLVARPAAAPEVWLRRVYLDLIGLPPTRAELQSFLADSSADARGRVVDRLLARPQYGERWGRHWMDVWRYSDWYGSRAINEIRYSQRHIWRWRDWIIESLNADKPYDQMIVEMLAGDELAPHDPDVLRATGFITRNWYKFDRDVWISAAVEHPAQAFLAVTLRCCRCHDHKYDPLAQEDYYRFRAFFEPHDVRTDRLTLDTATEKDATLGMVLKDGVSRVYDKQLDAATYVFLRGDSRSPDKQRPVLPGVPPMLTGNRADVAIVPVTLPLAAWYPAMKPDALAGLLAQSAAAVEQAGASVDQARLKASAADEKLASAEAAGNAEPAAEKPPVFDDDFSQPRPSDWQVVSGQWLWENGRLVQRSLENFATIVSTKTHPADFKARWKYRPLQQGGLRSIGFSYDYLDQGNSNDVYTHLSDQSQGVQAFHRKDGQQVYPPQGIVKTDSLKIGDEICVEIEVRGQSLAIWLNGERKLDYVLPSRRADGKFALWTLQGAAEFSELQIRELPTTVADLRRERQAAVDSAALGEKRLATAQAEQASLAARVAAEQLRYSGRPIEEAKPSMLAASRAEREVAVAKSAENVLQAEQHLARLMGEHADADQAAAVPPEALAEAEAKVAAARKTLDDARLAVANADGGYVPLGEQYPATSSGRRLALARWIADGQNPRTARVAINHIWLRHFGRALVPTVDDFGLNGQPPSHPELLDWLACELVENGWSMKQIHRLIVLSTAYGRSSAPGDAHADANANEQIDRENVYLWRMNSRRMEAEVVRDSVLATSGDLDTRLGGPEIPESDGLTTPRRSLYFRATPNEKMKLLELFDAADPNACYRRRESIVPQQALALLNSSLVQDHARALADRLARDAQTGDTDTEIGDHEFVVAAFETVLSRSPTPDEVQTCLGFLDRNTAQLRQPNLATFPVGGGAARAPAADPRQRARENLLLVLYSHHEFVTVR